MNHKEFRAQTAFRPGVMAVMVAVSLGAAQAATARPNFNLFLSGTTDSNDGRTLDADASITNASWWQLGAGGGSTRSLSSTGTLRGTSIRAFADVHSARFGARGYYQYWRAAPYALRTTGARTSFTANNLQLSITGETKNLGIDYTADPFSGQRDTAHFNGSGWGAGANYRYQKWGLYLSGIWYQYGALSRYMQSQFSSNPPPPPGGASGPASSGIQPTSSIQGILEEELPPPNLPPPMAPGVPGLTGSLMAFSTGVLNHQFAAGVAHDFKRSTLYFDWTGSKDVVSEKAVNYYSTSYLYQFTGVVRAVATVGVSRSDYGSSNYGGLSLGMDF